MVKTTIEIPKDQSVKVVGEVPMARLDAQDEKLDKILTYIDDIKSQTPEDYLTIPEFMERCKISRWTVNDLRDKGKLKIIQIGEKKLYIPFSEVNRFFRGELSF